MFLCGLCSRILVIEERIGLHEAKVAYPRVWSGFPVAQDGRHISSGAAIAPVLVAKPARRKGLLPKLGLSRLAASFVFLATAAGAGGVSPYLRHVNPPIVYASLFIFMSRAIY